jgi:ribosomal RNA-processing protein 8
LDHILTWIQQRHQGAVIADFGCGDARLAQTLQKKHTVHSFDLVSINPLVTACDIAHVPLADKSVDVVVFCLSLMGTNTGDFLREANRVLKIGGHIKIAEVRSRFQDKKEENLKEKEKEGFKKFMNILKETGFKIIHKDFSNTMFLLLEGVKMEREIGEVDGEYSIKPCLYKKR